VYGAYKVYSLLKYALLKPTTIYSETHPNWAPLRPDTMFGLDGILV